jgi:ABC-type uncharacterized transport system substrate-binding protein
MYRLSRFLCFISSLLLSLLFFTQETISHPHVFIVTRYTLVFDKNGLAGIHVNWQFDEYFSAMISGDYDSDQNGVFDPAENQLIEREAFHNMKKYSYFTFIKIDKKPFETKIVRDFSASLDENILIYEFFIPCNVSATSSYREIRVAAYDPSYYSAIFFAKYNALSLEKEDKIEYKSRIAENKEETYYYGMVHPWELTFYFRSKSQS